MKIRMLKTAAGPWGVWTDGETVEAESGLAAALAAVGSAELLEAPAPVVPDPEPEPEPESEPIVEFAVAKPARKRRSRG